MNLLQMKMCWYTAGHIMDSVLYRHWSTLGQIMGFTKYRSWATAGHIMDYIWYKSWLLLGQIMDYRWYKGWFTGGHWKSYCLLLGLYERTSFNTCCSTIIVVLYYTNKMNCLLVFNNLFYQDYKCNILQYNIYMIQLDIINKYIKILQ